MIKHSKKAQRADLINWLHHVIDINEPDLTNGPTDMEIEIPVEIDDKTTQELIETNMRDRGIRFKVDYTDKTQDNNYYYMYIWNQDNLNSNSSMDYTWEIQADDFRYGTQRGYITRADIEAFIQDLMDTYECTVTHPTEDTWYLTDLSWTDYEELERVYWREVGYYISAKAENVNSSKRGAKMIKRAKNLNSAVNGTFNEKAFDHYVKSLVADCVEYASDCGDPVQIIEGMYPSYNWEWACEGTDPAWDKLRNELQNALYNYIKYSYLAYKK